MWGMRILGQFAALTEAEESQKRGDLIGVQLDAGLSLMHEVSKQLFDRFV